MAMGYKEKTFLITLACLSIFSLWWTDNPYYTARYSLINLCCLFIFWLVTEVKHRQWLIYAVVIAGCLVSVETILEFTGHSVIFIHNEITGTIGNTNYLGAYLLFPIFFCLLLPRKWLAVVPLLLIALLLSRCRAAWIACFVGMSVFVLFQKRRVLSLSLIAVFLAGVAGYIHLDKDITNIDTLSYRTKYWSGAWELIRENPLFGTGFDGYRSEVYEAQARIERKRPGFFEGYDEPKPRRVHNWYLQAWVDGGMVWALALFSFVGMALIRAYKTRQYALFACLIAILVDGFFFFPSKIISIWLMVWVTMGMVYNENSIN